MLFTAHQYTVTDTDITPTGKTEVYMQETREAAIAACLYTHKLHNGNAIATPRGVIHCPTCGQMAVVNTPQPATYPMIEGEGAPQYTFSLPAEPVQLALL